MPKYQSKARIGDLGHITKVYVEAESSLEATRMFDELYGSCINHPEEVKSETSYVSRPYVSHTSDGDGSSSDRPWTATEWFGVYSFWSLPLTLTLIGGPVYLLWNLLGKIYASGVLPTHIPDPIWPSAPTPIPLYVWGSVGVAMCFVLVLVCYALRDPLVVMIPTKVWWVVGFILYGGVAAYITIEFFDVKNGLLALGFVSVVGLVGSVILNGLSTWAKDIKAMENPEGS